MGSSPAADSDALTRTVVRAAFLARLVCLLVALLLALDDPQAARAATAVVLLTATSAAGRTRRAAASAVRVAATVGRAVTSRRDRHGSRLA